MNRLIRDEILTLAEYRLDHHPCRIKLNQNENPYELPAGIKEEIVRKLVGERWSRYPSFVPRMQIERVAEFAGWTPGGTLIGNGSNDLLQLLFTSVLERGASVVISQPCFTLYKILGRSMAADVHEVRMLRPFAFAVDSLIETANRTGAKMIVLCSPNNPTGTSLPRESLRRIIKNTTALVVLDEAYVQFAGETQVALLKEFERLVILQTFSKAFGAAGLRFGYLLASPGIAGELQKVKLPYSVNIFTLTAVDVLLERWPEIKKWIASIVAERDRMRHALGEIPSIRAHDSCANFLLIESMVKPPAEVFSGLLKRGILIRDVSSYPMLERGLRVSIGTPEENREFIAALKEVA